MTLIRQYERLLTDVTHQTLCRMVGRVVEWVEGPCDTGLEQCPPVGGISHRTHHLTAIAHCPQCVQQRAVGLPLRKGGYHPARLPQRQCLKEVPVLVINITLPIS